MRTGWTLMAAAILALTMAPAAHAGIETKEVTYKQGETVLTGFFAWDGAAEGKRPGVIVVHEWWGHNDHARNQARRLAEAGYVAFALDMYGKGKVTTHPEEAGAFARDAMEDREVMAARFDAALDQLTADPRVDPDRIAAIGYCFGGSVVLDMVRAGVDLDAAATFHAGLGSAMTAEKGKVKARVLVNTGGADPMVPAEQVEAFRREMEAAGAQATVISYPGARHGFTNPDAASFGMEALAYDADADGKSWAAMLAMFSEVLG